MAESLDVSQKLNSHSVRFRLGHVVATPDALNAIARSGESAAKFLGRHSRGDWGTVSPEDAKANDDAVAKEGDLGRQQRVLSAYVTANNDRIWIITEWDRSVTTILLPENY